MLTSHQDELRQELIEAEMKQEPRAGAERGNAGIAHVIFFGNMLN